MLVSFGPLSAGAEVRIGATPSNPRPCSVAMLAACAGPRRASSVSLPLAGRFLQPNKAASKVPLASLK